MAAGVVSECPRCGGKMLGSAGEVSCINCGYEKPRNGNGPTASALVTNTSAELGAAAVATLKRLAGRMRELEEEKKAIREEAKRFFAIAGFCEVDVPLPILQSFGKQPKTTPPGKRRDDKRVHCSCGLESTPAGLAKHLQSNRDHKWADEK